MQEAGFAQSRSGGDQGAISGRARRALIQHDEIRFLEAGYAVRVGEKVVDQFHLIQFELRRKMPRIHHPWQVRGLYAAIHYRSRQTERRGLDLPSLMFSEILADDVSRPAELGAREDFDIERLETIGRSIK